MQTETLKLELFNREAFVKERLGSGTLWDLSRQAPQTFSQIAPLKRHVPLKVLQSELGSADALRCGLRDPEFDLQKSLANGAHVETMGGRDSSLRSDNWADVECWNAMMLATCAY